jgi:dynactin 1
VYRFIAQAAHLAEIHLGDSDLDIGEQQLGHILTIDLTLDTLAAGIGFTKQTIATLSKESGQFEGRFADAERAGVC